MIRPSAGRSPEDTGASAKPSGSRASHEAPAGLHPSGFDPSRELLTKVLDYYEGRKPYDFYRLPDFQRECDAFDAWQEIAGEIRKLLGRERKTRAQRRDERKVAIALEAQALAAGSRRAKTPKAVECEASQSGATAQRPNDGQSVSPKGGRQ